MRTSSTFFSAALIGSALADTHFMYSGYFSGSTLIGLEFDDTANTLAVVKNITLPASTGQKFISLDSRTQNLYVATTGYFQSFSIDSDYDLTYTSNVSSITTSDNCTNSNHVAVSTVAPWTVFGIVFGYGCSTLAISVDDSGALASHIANITYNATSGVHGAWVSPEDDFLYSADNIGSGVYVHSFDATAATTEEVQYLDAATDGANPRHLTVHPNGKWVYVVYEDSSEIAAYARDNTTGELTFNATYPLLPDGFTNTSSYWAGEVLLSLPETGVSPKYVIGATRSHTVGISGYVSALALDAETGAVTEQLFLVETTNSGGSANAVSPSKFSEEHFAITDSGSNFIEIWEIDGNTASAVAHVDTEKSPVNVQWVS